MPTETCPHIGCKRSITKPTELGARRAMTMHINMAHKRQYNHAKAKSETKVKVRGKYRKSAQEVEFKINYCPGCGFDIHRMAMGIVLANKIKI